MRPIELLYERAGVVVVDKPAGLETTGRTRDDPGGLEHHLRARLRCRVWPVHQLDRDTTGVLIFVRRKSLVATWQAHLSAAQKHYLAIVHGNLTAQTISEPLRYSQERRRWVVHKDGKSAVTAVTPLCPGPAHSWIEARPTTGRTHQIRVHLASIGHPLVGESRHVTPACALHPRHALHLGRIQIAGRVFRSPLPTDLRRLSESLNLEAPRS